MSIDWEKFVSTINAHQKVLLTSHVRPDCDALGSELGMARVLEAVGKDVVIVNAHPTPPNIAFIDPDHRIRVLHETIEPAELSDIELLIVLDTSAWVQLGTMADVLKSSSAKKIIVDHHVSEDDLNAVAFKNTSSAATGCLVVQAAEHLGVTLTPEIAMPLFAAVATDTGWFRFVSADAETFSIGAKLVAAGAKPAEIYANLYEQDTLARVRLRGAILSNIVCEMDGRLAHTFVTLDDFQRTGAHPSDTEDVINMALAIAGTEFAVIMIEQATGGFKLSFRSQCDLDCSEIAAHFDGGGHKKAAGAFVAGTLDEVQPKVLDRIRSLMR